MNPKYFKDTIYTELNASLDYMKKAIDSIKSHPKWSFTFKIMSDERYDHAENLYKMFLEFYLDFEGQETYLNSLRDAIVEMFAKQTGLIDGYKATYEVLEETGNE